jgi:hypothetical protein
MGTRLLFTLALLAIPSVADSELFDKIPAKQMIAVVLPDGSCYAKVVRREPGQLTVRLTSTTTVCGKRKSFVRVLRGDVRDVVDRRTVTRGPDTAYSERCVGKVLAGAVIAGLGMEEAARSYAPGLLTLAGGGIAAALLCREPHPRYGVFADRIIQDRP